MTPPGFWQAPRGGGGWRAAALAPLGALYAGATARRVARAPECRPAVPVICVGNAGAGGAGKTPTVMALLMQDSLAGAHVVSRGYGGSLKGPVRVDPRRHAAAEVGDEPLLLSAFAPVWVARDRAAGARAAETAGATAIILDDGFQNPEPAKDLSILVVDAGAGFGNGRVIPAGPLREPVAAALTRAQLVLSIGPGADQARLDAEWPELAARPRLRGHLAPLQTGMDWQGLRAFAFAGIGRPGKFFDTLRGLGADLVGELALSDHQPLGPALLRRIGAEAARLNAQLVTTEKDAVRLPPSWRGQVLTLPVRLELEDAAPLKAALARLF